jgi:peptidoglycan/LPS O-acetylase OafA/YrhL
MIFYRSSTFYISEVIMEDQSDGRTNLKSSTGEYYIGLDHVRAAAAFIVFSWHFIQINGGALAPPPVFPLSILTEGHTGVSIFMALSGYLFASLLDGKTVLYRKFIWNRFIRLFPLLLFVIIVAGLNHYLEGRDMIAYVTSVFAGIIKPSLPNGGWSITVEFHFYLILPLLLAMSVKSKYSLMLALLLVSGARFLLYQQFGEVHSFSYWTIVGRFDQFILGILAYSYREQVTGKHFKVVVGLLMFLGFFWYFDYLGGFHNSPYYPSPNPIWIFQPTAEGFAYAFLIAWYDRSFRQSSGVVSRFIALIGTCSYSIYLLHFFVVFWIAKTIDTYLIDLSNIYLAMLFSILGFLLILPFAYLSYRFIEKPFFRFRVQYILAAK